MKKRLLAQILVLCMVFSMLPTTAWATDEVTFYPYIEDIPNNGQISADKTLTVIATSNDLCIIGMSLRAVNADDGRVVVPVASHPIQSSPLGDGVYEYKQDFVLIGDLRITGGKWTFEVISEYKPTRTSPNTRTDVQTLPDEFNKKFWYPYYTIVNGIPSVPITPDATRYCAIPDDLTLRPGGGPNAGELAAVETGGTLTDPAVYVMDSFGAPVTGGPIPSEKAIISAANGNGAWGISGVTTQSFSQRTGGRIGASFPNLQLYTKNGEAFPNAQVKFTVGAQSIEYDSKAAFNIPGAKVTASNHGIKAGETVELRITEAKDLKYMGLAGSKSVTVTDVTGGANRRVFSGSASFTDGTAIIQLGSSAFTQATLGQRRLDVKIDDIFQTLHTELNVESTQNLGTPANGGTVTINSMAYANAGTAVADVNPSEFQNAVNRVAQSGYANLTVHVDVSSGVSVECVKANLPASAINDLASRTNASLTVTTPLTVVTIPNDSLRRMERSISGLTVSIAIRNSNTVDIALIQDGRNVGVLSSGMKVEVPSSYTSRTSSMVASLLNSDGTETIIPKSVQKSNGDLAILLDIGSATILYQDSSKHFSDINSGHWAFDAIAFVSSHGLFQGTTSTRFDGSVTMNRAMLVTVLHRLESAPYSGTHSFVDVPADSYYAQAAAWAACKGIVQGDGIGFNGERAVTRQEMAVMLYRYVQTINGSKGQLGSYRGMGGADQVAEWADEAMRWAVGSGIIQGSNGNLNPQGNATRAEVAQMMANFVKLITK